MKGSRGGGRGGGGRGVSEALGAEQMGVDDHYGQARQLFADQFEAEDDHYLYRKSMKGAPIRVSAAERDRYIKLYNKFAQFSSRLIFWGTIALIATSVLTNFPDGYVFGGIALIIVAAVVSTLWARNIPARELRGRGTVGEAKSRTEVQALHLARITYGELALPFLAGVPVLFWLSKKVDLLHGWGRLWLALIVLLFILTSIRALQKWRFEAGHKSNNK